MIASTYSYEERCRFPLHPSSPINDRWALSAPSGRSGCGAVRVLLEGSRRLLAGELVQDLDRRRRVVDAGTDHVGRALGGQEVAHLALRLRLPRFGEVVL